ncbi:Ig-like domain-containing protein [Kingella kingae]|uniref:Ig-like domain-containing protein n=1 Tax=Kingella kingae TaxID=504 RepID=UPI0014130F1A|nr:Ig-like domain-containing protein [Kingella kingae]MDK4587288.1 Ig-like domain-containing protein [Kingella kingae]MDK4613330.1 Ig-like domain-containing protein [Kingella kingae]MDK4615419.1 Ig-like domain-containing protein [Kingella kingae]MDK4667114.1 Ig-like domain-containing protein [Kingella kingae]QIP51065.1 Ig-like domain-containing protein [Kingella kingae]
MSTSNKALGISSNYPIFKLNNLTSDNIISAEEAKGNIAITGMVSGTAKVGDVVTVTVNGKNYTGKVAANKTFSISVSGNQLVEDKDKLIEVSIVTKVGNTTYRYTKQTQFEVDTTAIITKPKPAVINPIITLDAKVAGDDLVSLAEAKGKLNVTGKVGGSAKAGDTVTLIINDKKYTGKVDNKNTFSIGVNGSDLAADKDRTIEAVLNSKDSTGKAVSVKATDTYKVEVAKPKPAVINPIITLDAKVAGDDLVSLAEAKGKLNVTGKVGGSAKAGDTVTLIINDKKYTGKVDNKNTFSIGVNGSDLAADKDRTIEAVLNSKDSTGKAVSVKATDTYKVETAAPIASIMPKPTVSTATLTLDAITGDDLLNYAETKGDVKLTGSVGGSAKKGDTVELNINNKKQKVTVSEGNKFSLTVKGSELAADKDGAIEVILTTKNGDKPVTLSSIYNFTAIHDVSGKHANDKGQVVTPYFVDSISISDDNRRGYLYPTTKTYARAPRTSYYVRDDQLGPKLQGKWAGPGKGIVVRYSFALRNYNGETNFKEFSVTQKQAVRDALAEYAKYANITFEEVLDSGDQLDKGNADFRFYFDDLRNHNEPGTVVYNSVKSSQPNLMPTTQNMCLCCGGFHRTARHNKTTAIGSEEAQNAGVSMTAGYAYYGGDVHINSLLYAGDKALSKGTLKVPYGNGWFDGGYGTLVHEIGHSLGFKHTGNYNGQNGKAEGPYLPDGEENSGHSIMSYKDLRDSNQNVIQTGQGLQIFDLAALHYRYGVNKAENSGNNTYRFKAYNKDKVGNDIYIWDGSGIDTFDASDAKDKVTVDLTPGSWNYIGSKTSHLITDTLGHKVTGQSFIGYGTQIENLIGSAFNDTLRGNDADNIITGGKGNDTIFGDLGNDTLDGGEGVDQLSGGKGDDIYIVDNTGDTVTEAANEGKDTVISSVNYTLSANVENLTLVGKANLSGTGNDLDNVITGNRGNNTLIGGKGNDTYVFSKAGGHDTIITRGGGNDTLRFAGINMDAVLNKTGGVKQNGNDLVLSVSNSRDSVTIKDWFQGGRDVLKTFEFANGKKATADQVASYISASNQMVHAMASFGVATGTSSSLNNIDQQTSTPVLAASLLS